MEAPHENPLRAKTVSSSQDRLAALFARRNYELLGELGRGGMGIVYLARDTKLDRKVALKTLSPDRAARENSLRRFEREAKTFAQIRHPHIAMLYEFEDEGPLQYLALEYIDGYDLESERRRGRKWNPQEAARIIQTLARALDYTHGKGILHRDIKPGNVLIENGTNRVVLTDFGLAKGRKDETLTASGFAVGTPAYMAPEQISDQFGLRPDGRADVFSLGTVFYEMLAGKHPFLGADDLKTMRNIVHNQPIPLRDIDPTIPEAIERIVFAMIEKKPESRASSAKEVADLLEHWLHNQEVSGQLPAMDIPRPQAADDEPASKAPLPVQASNPTPSTQSGVTAASPRGLSIRDVVLIAALVGIATLVVGVLIGYLLLGS
ncbi:serine/threonine protein kinase [Candidatus Poribacteria bacterium]|nr:serine/threonine protein kinase [Candidatus Poribacteria bacterium]